MEKTVLQSINIKHELEAIKPWINREMERIIPRQITEDWMKLTLGPAAYKYDIQTLQEEFAVPVWDFLDRGGKRWRPALMLWSCGSVQGKIEDALMFTPLPELIHTGTLIADDVEDKSEVRRGKPAIHVLYGLDTAVNNSGALYFLPQVLLYRNMGHLSAEKRLALFEVIGEEMFRASMGQAMDIHWHNHKRYDLTEEHYLQMCAYKTGVLARMSAKIGVILGNGSLEQINVLGKFAESIGVGFQIQDDILNLFPASQEWGKAVGDDITEGKRTILVLRALQLAPAKEKEELIQILKSHTRNEFEIIRAIEIIKKTGAVEYSLKRAEDIVIESWRNVENQLAESVFKQKLKALAEFVVQRKV
ncbi:MAG: polyprenyl synthetase family protein [Candidatus Diapherotrites archaeon]|nr:polyprenyl synthetase family protein [Candidatus Diapherotrites archaeon]